MTRSSNAPVFQGRNFCQAAKVALGTAETRSEKRFNQFPGECMAQYTAAQAYHIHVVVFDALMRRECFMNQTGSDPRYFVRDDARSHATAADGNAAIDLLASDCTGQRHNEVRVIVIRVQFAVAEIDYRTASRAQLSDEVVLQLQSPMVGSDADAVRYSCQSRRWFQHDLIPFNGAGAGIR